jgi:hypothetical protein
VLQLPVEVVAMLAERRLTEIAHRPYTEKNYDISVQKRNPRKEKLKRKIQYVSLHNIRDGIYFDAIPNVVQRGAGNKKVGRV